MTEVTEKKGLSTAAGCALGCLAMVLLIVLIGTGTVYYLIKIGPFAPAPRVDTRSHLGGSPALTVRLDAKAPGAFSPALLEDPNIAAYNGALLQLFWPYEGTVAVFAVPGSTTIELAAALSMPRGSSVLLEMLQDMRKDFEKNGRTVRVLQADGERQGVVTARGALPLPLEANALRAEAWPAPLDGDAPAIEGGHFIELALDNRNGEAALGLTGIAQMMGEGNPESPAQLSLLSQVRLIKGSHLVRTAWAALDFAPSGDVGLQYRVTAWNEVSAQLLKGILDQVPDQLTAQMDLPGVVIQHDLKHEGVNLSATLNFEGFGEAMREGIREFNQGRATDPFGFLGLPEPPPVGI